MREWSVVFVIEGLSVKEHGVFVKEDGVFVKEAGMWGERVECEDVQINIWVIVVSFSLPD